MIAGGSAGHKDHACGRAKENIPAIALKSDLIESQRTQDTQSTDSDILKSSIILRQ